MLTEESESVIRMAIIVIVMSLLLLVIASMAYYSYRYFEKESWYEGSKEYVAQQADVYKFTVVGDVSGNDIMEFIIKYDVMYDYLIIEENSAGSVVSYPLIKGYSNKLISAGLSERKTWKWYTESYLAGEVFKNTQDEEFLVKPVLSNGDVSGFEFLQKSTNEKAKVNTYTASLITGNRNTYSSCW